MTFLTYRVLSAIQSGGGPDTDEQHEEAERLRKQGWLDFHQGARPAYGCELDGKTYFGRYDLANDEVEAAVLAAGEEPVT